MSKFYKSYGVPAVAGGSDGGGTTPEVHLFQIVAGKELTPVPYEGVKKVSITIPTTEDDTSEWIEKIDVDTPIIETDGVAVARKMDDNTLVLIWNGTESTVQTDMINGTILFSFSQVNSPYLDTTVSPNVYGSQTFYIPSNKVQ
jgi:hypothetical protein